MFFDKDIGKEAAQQKRPRELKSAIERELSRDVSSEPGLINLLRALDAGSARL